MLEHIISDKRIRFLPSKQKAFIEEVINITKLNTTELAQEIGVSRRTLADWKREKFLMTETVFKKMCAIAKIAKPKNVKILEPHWNVSKAGIAGAKKLYAKYGKFPVDENFRKEKWLQWWKRVGKNNVKKKCDSSITIPEKSALLAEFTGVMLGDGGISKFQIDITLDSKTDKKYSLFVCSSISKLFAVEPSIYYNKNSRALSVVVSRKALVQFCNSTLGLPVGNKLKQGIKIPDWILENSSYSIACVRGLVDTDGCFFNHRYVSSKKQYQYLKIDFTSMSNILLEQVKNILQNNGIYVKLSSRPCIRIESEDGVKKYIALFGTSNPKNVQKIKKWSRVRVVE
ncbi:MAG: LAGLIDADG family homing endonuclease [bacterium]